MLNIMVLLLVQIEHVAAFAFVPYLHTRSRKRDGEGAREAGRGERERERDIAREREREKALKKKNIWKHCFPLLSVSLCFLLGEECADPVLVALKCLRFCLGSQLGARKTTLGLED